jgi:hypothetical protein
VTLANGNDAACCPGDLVEWQWTFGEGRLNALEAIKTGRFSLATLAGTVCSVEGRFLEQLGGARTFGFMLGRLAISYTRGDGSRGTMLFDASR